MDKPPKTFLSPSPLLRTSSNPMKSITQRISQRQSNQKFIWPKTSKCQHPRGPHWQTWRSKLHFAKLILFWLLHIFRDFSHGTHILKIGSVNPESVAAQGNMESICLWLASDSILQWRPQTLLVHRSLLVFVFVLEAWSRSRWVSLASVFSRLESVVIESFLAKAITARILSHHIFLSQKHQ